MPKDLKSLCTTLTQTHAHSQIHSTLSSDCHCIFYNTVIVANFSFIIIIISIPPFYTVYQCIHKSCVYFFLSALPRRECITAEYTRDDAYFICTTLSHCIVWHSSHQLQQQHERSSFKKYVNCIYPTIQSSCDSHHCSVLSRAIYTQHTLIVFSLRK